LKATGKARELKETWMNLIFGRKIELLESADFNEVKN